MSIDPYKINSLDADVIEHHVGQDFWRAFQGFESDGEMANAMFRTALEAEAMSFEFSDADREAAASNPGLTYETHPTVRQTACERTAAAIRVLVGFSEVRGSSNRSW